MEGEFPACMYIGTSSIVETSITVSGRAELEEKLSKGYRTHPDPAVAADHLAEKRKRWDAEDKAYKAAKKGK